MSTTVRISDETHRRVVALSTATGQKISQVVDHAVLDYERQHFWDAFDAGYAAIAADPQAMAEVEAERAGEAGSLSDGIE